MTTLSTSQRAVAQKYFIGNEKEWYEVANRVAKVVSQVETNTFLRENYYKEFKALINDLKFVPAGSILANAGHGTGGLQNCFVLGVEDNIQSISQLVMDAVMTTKFRGGIGIHIGSKGQPNYVRPKNAPFTDGKALGPCAVLDMVSDCSRKLTTGNKARRGAFMFSMDWRHPDIWEFIQAKTESVIDAQLFKAAVTTGVSQEEFDKAWVESHLSIDGKRERRWYNANISVQVDDEFFEYLEFAQESKYVNPNEAPETLENREVTEHGKAAWALKLWNLVAAYAHQTADPGLLLVSNAKRHSPIQDFISTTNPCFTGETLVLTKKGSFPIKKLAGSYHEVWDGTQWVLAPFAVTGVNKEVFKITLKSGATIKATANHGFYLSNGKRVELKDLKVGQKLLVNTNKPELPQVDLNNLEVANAYLAGFMDGDGSWDYTHNKPVLSIYEPKFICQLALEKSGVQFGDVVKGNKRNAVIPNEKWDYLRRGSSGKNRVFNELPLIPENVPYLLAYITGLFDADGTTQDHPKSGWKYQWSSSNKAHFDRVLAILNYLGVNASMDIDNRTHKDWGNKGGVCKSKISYRLSFDTENTKRLGTYCPFQRLTKFTNKRVKQSSENNWAKIVSIEPAGIADKVYCCNVQTNHSVALNSRVVTANCGEIWLPIGSSCNLGSIVVSKFIERGQVNWEDLSDAIWNAVRFLDNVLDASNYATEQQRINITEKFRQIGLGIMGWADALKLLKIPYASQAHLDFIDEFGSFFAQEAYEASQQLALERGECGVWPLISHLKVNPQFDDNYPRRNSTVLSIAPTGSIAQLAGCSWAFEPDFGLTTYKQVFVDASAQKQEWVAMLNPYLEPYNLSEADQAIVKATGSIRGTKFAQEYPELIGVFAIAREVSPEWHIKVQAQWQKWIDSSISKTINLPKEATIEDIKEAYLLSNKLGLKGVTVYRSGTLESEPVKVGTDELESDKVQLIEEPELAIDYPECDHNFMMPTQDSQDSQESTYDGQESTYDSQERPVNGCRSGSCDIGGH